MTGSPIEIFGRIISPQAWMAKPISSGFVLQFQWILRLIKKLNLRFVTALAAESFGTTTWIEIIKYNSLKHVNNNLRRFSVQTKCKIYAHTEAAKWLFLGHNELWDKFLFEVRCSVNIFFVIYTLSVNRAWQHVTSLASNQPLHMILLAF